jgi:hypothetical protein
MTLARTWKLRSVEAGVVNVASAGAVSQSGMPIADTINPVGASAGGSAAL